MKSLNHLIAILLLVFLTGCSDKKSPESNKEKINPQLKSEAGKEIKDVSGMSQEEISDEVSGASFSKKYPLKSGVIVFEQKGIAGDNKIIVYFDDYGTKERNESYNSDGSTNEVKFSDGSNMYLITFKYSKDKVAYLMGSGLYGTEMKFISDPFNNASDKVKYGYSKLPNMTVAGKECQAYKTKISNGETTFAGWNNILLYTKAKLSFGESVIKAVEFRENVSVDPSMFKVPEGFQIKKM